jgi:hypothetical protein
MRLMTMNVTQPSFSSLPVLLGPFLAQAGTQADGEVDSFWGGMAWTLLPLVVILLFVVWWKHQMQEPD